MKTCRPYLVHILQEINYLLAESAGLFRCGLPNRMVGYSNRTAGVKNAD